VPISRAIVIAPATLGSGGLGTAAAEITDGLRARGCETEFIGFHKWDPVARAAASRPFRRAFGTATSRRVGHRAIRRALPRSGWDLLYATPGMVPIERGSGIRVVHQATRHPAFDWEAMRRGERETGGRSDVSRSEARRCENEIAKADLIHVTTEAVRRELLETGVASDRLVTAPLGVDLDRFRPGPKRARMTIAFVGPLSMRKGVELVATLAELTRGEAVVEAVGGPTCPWSRRIVESARFVTRTSVPEMLAAAHYLVLPSRSDGFAYAVLEALASGTVPIVTPEVGASEVVRRLDERLVVPRQDFAEGARDLVRALDHAELAVRARALAEEFDRNRTSIAAATAVLERAEELADARQPAAA
jgi:glycosyltransferase involved in cell wall biosynthesis